MPCPEGAGTAGATAYSNGSLTAAMVLADNKRYGVVMGPVGDEPVQFQLTAADLLP